MIAITDQESSVPYLKIVAGGPVLSLDDISTESIANGIRKEGVILLRGFDYSVKDFARFTSKFCTHSVYNNSRGRETVDEKNNIQTVSLGMQAFPLHPELSRVPWSPDACFFACQSPPSKGGETIICDGVRVVEELSSDVIKYLLHQPLRYVNQFTVAECRKWLGREHLTRRDFRNLPASFPFELSLQDGLIYRSYVTPALRYTMFARRLAFGNFLLFSRYFYNRDTFPTFYDGSVVSDEIMAEIKRVSDALSVVVRWQKGDLLILDNTRFMHGRNAILNKEERRILSYFGYLKFARLSPAEAAASWRRSPV